MFRRLFCRFLSIVFLSYMILQSIQMLLNHQSFRAFFKIPEMSEYIDNTFKEFEVVDFIIFFVAIFQVSVIIHSELLRYNNSNTSRKYQQRIAHKEFSLCPDCNHTNTYYMYWCQDCNSKRFQQNFDKWTSGNEHVNKFIQESQSARNYEEILEWIPYDRLRNIRYLAKGGFSTIYEAIWLDGNIFYWNDKKQTWKRGRHELTRKDHKNARKKNVKSPLKFREKKGKYVALKSLNNSSNIREDFLNEWKIYLKFVYSAKNDNTFIMKIYGITQDPETLNYMIVLQVMKMGNLRSNLMIKKYNPNDKYYNLYRIAASLSALHNCNLVHGDFHSGNLLFQNDQDCYVSDFGLSRPADQPINSDKIYGVFPYVAPEVLRGKQYTKDADIYSFGIVMWEFTSGIPAFNNISHDHNLFLKVCKGYRPKIIEGTDPDYAKLMKRCWDTDPNKRPTAEELKTAFDEWQNKYPIKESRTKVPENEPVVKNHPLSCYTSRKIDYSVKLNELLDEDENMIYEDNNSNDITYADNTLIEEEIGNLFELLAQELEKDDENEDNNHNNTVIYDESITNYVPTEENISETFDQKSN